MFLNKRGWFVRKDATNFHKSVFYTPHGMRYPTTESLIILSYFKGVNVWTTLYISEYTKAKIINSDANTV